VKQKEGCKMLIISFSFTKKQGKENVETNIFVALTRIKADKVAVHFLSI